MSPRWPPSWVQGSGDQVEADVPGSGLVVEGAGSQAAVQDADQPVRDGTEGLVVGGASGPLSVVEGSGSGWGSQGAVGLEEQRVTESPVPGVAGEDDLLDAGGLRDR
jgi:hypothetical protein